MTEQVVMVVVGILLVVASFLAKGFSYGMPPHHDKPTYPVTRVLRVLLAVFGLLSVAVGLGGLLRR